MRFETSAGTTLRYRLVPGSTVRWGIRMDLDLRVQSSAGEPADTLDAMVNSRLDCEVLRLEGQTALVRPFAHQSDFWVRGGTLDEDDVADPMSGFVRAFLLDDLGSVVPVADTNASALARPEDGTAGRALLLALFPPYPEEEVRSGAQWEVDLHESSVQAPGPVTVSCGLAKLVMGGDQRLHPVVLHGLEYRWSKPPSAEDPRVFGVEGHLRLAAETIVSPADGWSKKTEATAQIELVILDASGPVQTVTTRLKVVAERE